MTSSIRPSFPKWRWRTDRWNV